MYWKYLWYIVRHKWYVFLACRRLHVSLWQSLIHDWTKFLPREFFPYAHYFHGTWPREDNDAYERHAFDQAWNHHQKANPHHWQYWLLTMDTKTTAWALWQMKPPFGAFTLAYKNQPFIDLPDDGDPMNENERYRAAGKLCNYLNRSVPTPLEMPERYVREMMADWMGAGRALVSQIPRRGINKQKILLSCMKRRENA